MIVTTAPKATPVMLRRAEEASSALSIPYVERGRFSVTGLQKKWRCPVLVAESSRLTLHNPGTGPLFYHPNAAMIRAKVFLKTGEDPMIGAAGLEQGMSFADMTLGLGADALVASLAVGKCGKVFGTEHNPVLSHIVKEGLREFETGVPSVNEAMRRIRVFAHHHLKWLKTMPESSVDVVYFDPMFTEQVSGADGLSPLKNLVSTVSDTAEFHQAVREARRVARKRVVLKDHFRSGRFQEGGFSVEVRPSATYHFGVWNKQDSAIMD
ncbi:class I SAM-dependent methyltransferase [Alteribacter natronophilus]|uniref:class I SAM-dependent methyltransferase n=1 Tax=Alteribacter natronophilus TaxID=2583810 RepID=UPI00110F2BB7|nr:class I SAM-dependent methyltransferase [Alteribacter natronophilus]TMW73291.1 hypothetical protein FGB90_02975 [Alteribacter natronophilus]